MWTRQLKKTWHVRNAVKLPKRRQFTQVTVTSWNGAEVGLIVCPDDDSFHISFLRRGALGPHERHAA